MPSNLLQSKNDISNMVALCGLKDKARMKVILDCIEKVMQNIRMRSYAERQAHFHKILWQVNYYLRRAHTEARSFVLGAEFS